MWTLDDNKTDSFVELRQVHNRLYELEAIRDDFAEWESEEPEHGTPAWESWSREQPEHFDSDMAEELEILQNFTAGLPYDGILINDSAWVEYARGIVRDCYNKGELPDSWVDYDAAADELRQDYSQFELDGETFLSVDA